MFSVCSGVCFLLSGAMLDAVFTYGPQWLGFALLQPYGAYPWQACNGHWPTPGMLRVVAASTALSRGESHASQSAVLHPFQQYAGADNFGGLAESHLIPPPSLHGGEGSSFPCLVPSNHTIDSESVVGI